MKLNANVLTRGIARNVFLAKKNSPHIFFVGGVVGVIGSAVLACKATLQLEEKLDEIKNDVTLIKAKTLEESTKTGVYSNDIDYQCTTYATVKTVKVIGRLYGPAILLGGASIAALTGSHIQLVRRNAALTATLATVTKAYAEYRLRVQEEIGKEKELDIYRGIRDKEVEIDGKKSVVKISDPLGRSPYSRIFDECSRYWKKEAELNYVFLEHQQNYANHRLRADGFVFLNDVYDDLGFDKTPEGQVVGWILNGDGDGYVDFGIFEAYNERFIKGQERVAILDFNVDGVIYDKI
jgi:hypothetical protein